MAVRTSLQVPRPFDLGATLHSHGWLWTHPFHPEPDKKRLVRIERIRNTPRRLVIRQAGTTKTHVRLEVTSDALERDRVAVRRRTATMLGLDEDLRGFYAMAADDPHLAPLLDHGAGRTCRGTTLWEDATKGIIQTNILWQQALRCMAKVCTLGPLHAASRLHAWPTPGEVLDAGATWLKEHARIGYRAAAIIRLAEEVEDGTRDLDALERAAPTMDTQVLVKELRTIRGIGPATAHALAGLLGKHDVVSVDSATISYVARHYPQAITGARPTEADVRAVFTRYGVWQGKAWWYEAWLKRHVATGPTKQ